MLTIIYNLDRLSNCYNLTKLYKQGWPWQRGNDHFQVNIILEVAKDLKSGDIDLKSVFSWKRCLDLFI